MVEKLVYKRPQTLYDVPFHYCAGCGHGIVHRLIAEALEERGLVERTIGLAPVGCAVLLYDYLRVDIIECAHGRPPAVATGIKRVNPDAIVFSIQGDGDLAAIGTAEAFHAVNRSENISIFFVNNAIYGMTGGQMAPTTLIGQKTRTTPRGRDQKSAGFPMRVSEMLAQLEGAKYIERVSVHSPAHIRRAKKAILKSFRVQEAGLGFSLVEILSPCPTNWGMEPLESRRWLEENMMAYYPLGVFKDTEI